MQSPHSPLQTIKRSFGTKIIFQLFVEKFSSLLDQGLTAAEIEQAEQELSPFRLTVTLKEMYKKFNGMKDEQYFGGEFLSLADAFSERESYSAMFRSMKMEFPKALFPIARYNYGNYWTPLSRSIANDSPVFEFAASDGDHELYLKYNNISSCIQTLLEEQKIAETNKYPDYSEHYVDYDALSAVQPRLNPDMYKNNQKSNMSANGVINVYDIDSLPDDWM